MAIAKRILFFFLTNLLVIFTINVLLAVFGVRPYLTAYGIDYNALLAFCFIWGMGGAFISLALSRFSVKMFMGVQVIDPQTTDSTLRRLVQTVHMLAQKAGISRMPEVGIYESDQMNAFATGPSKNHALVAVSTGLLQRMDQAQIEGVLGHEITHITNGDMVTMTLLQGIINSFAMFLSRAIAFAVSQNMEERNRYMVRGLLTVVLDLALTFFGFIIVAAFSRWREYRADAGGAQLAGRERMIGALRALQRQVNIEDAPVTQTVRTLQINGRQSGFLALFATHPPLDERIQRLQSPR